MLQFAEQEIILPTGPFVGQRFRADRQPFARPWIEEVDSGRWQRFVLTGPSQAGKTLQASVVPVMYHLFEQMETAIYGAPTMEMAADKWTQDVLPAIEASSYRELLPSSGGGSKGGTAESMQFRHGPTLRFMTGGGGDKKRAGFTSRIVVITEVDGMDEAGGGSRETDKISQIEARTNAFTAEGSARIYLECTVSTEEGRTWQELKNGTDSRLSLPCPHCTAFVTPDREHVTGWQGAADAFEASRNSMLCCPKCGTVWTEQERASANRLGKLVHKGQSVDESGTIVGMLPQTKTLAMRFTSVNNLFTTIAKVGEEEWKAERYGDASLNEKKLRQFWWALPSEAESVTLTEIDAMAICKRVVNVPRGRVPSEYSRVTVGIDLGKWLCHWVAMAWNADGTPHVIEYGRLEVPSQAMAEEVAILTALRRFRDEVCATGWPAVDANLPNVRPSLVIVDSGDFGPAAISFVSESGAGYLAAKGFGVEQVGPKRKTMFDPGYELVAQPAGYALLEINADMWKSYFHARIQTPIGQPGGLTLYHDQPTGHLTYAKHAVSEKAEEIFIAGRGLVRKWTEVNRNNHFLDASALACVGGHGVGIRLVTPQLPPLAPIAASPATADRPSWIPDRPTWINR